VPPAGEQAPVGQAVRVNGAASAAGELPVCGAARVGGRVTLSEATAAAMAEVKARMGDASRARDVVAAAVVADREERLSMAWPPSVPNETAPSSCREDDGQAPPPAASVVEPPAAFFRRVGGPASTISLVHSQQRTMGMPPPQRSPFSTKHYSSLPRRPRRTFVRKAAVMQVASTCADPDTPPSVHESDDDGADSVNDQDFDDIGPRLGGGPDDVVQDDQADVGDAIGDGAADNGVLSATEGADVRAAMSVAMTGNSAAFGPTAKRRAVSVPGNSRSYPLYTDGAAATLPLPQINAGVSTGAPSMGIAGAAWGPANSVASPLTSSAVGNSRKRSAPAGYSTGAGSSVAQSSAERAAASNALAERLAARTRNPNVFPAACWMPEAQAVLAAAQYSRAGPGRPPVAPVVRQGAVPVGAAVGVLPHRPSASLPPPPARRPAPQRTHVPPMAPGDDGSSSDMNDDDLVASYITPPASPVASPRSTRPSTGSRRRSGGSRGTRGTRVAVATGTAAAAAAAAAQTEGGEPPSADKNEILSAVRNGFSSVRRELTRFRAELVVVKSQAASALRRMDGLAAAADGSEAGNGVLCERLGQVEKALTSLGDRLPTAERGAADGTGDDGQSVRAITEIKVRPRTSVFLLLIMHASLVLRS